MNLLDHIKILPRMACPYCGNVKWVILEMSANTYYTNRDGKVAKSIENYHKARGKCLTCGREYDMYPAYDTFIPLTPIRKLLLEFQPEELNKTNNQDFTYIENPMEKK